MIREEYLRRLIDAAHVGLYLSGSDGARIYWPWRMEPPKEASLSYRNACEMYVIDSDPQNPDTTTEDVLDTAYRLDAEVASLADVYLDAEATVDSLLRGMEVADSHPFDGTLLLPLQQPFVDSYRELGEPTDAWIGLGGLKDATDTARISAARSFRRAFGTGIHLHGFGWGPNERLAAAIRDDKTLLDSVDYSTPCRDIPIDTLPGDEVMSVQAAYAGARLVRDLRRVTPFVDESDVSSGEQVTVGVF